MATVCTSLVLIFAAIVLTVVGLAGVRRPDWEPRPCPCHYDLGGGWVMDRRPRYTVVVGTHRCEVHLVMKAYATRKAFPLIGRTNLRLPKGWTPCEATPN